MLDPARIQQCIFRAIDAVNDELGDPDFLEKTPTTSLYGVPGALDSLGLISFISAIEREIENECGQTVSLYDRVGLSSENDPFQRVDTLADFLSELVASKQVA